MHTLIGSASRTALIAGVALSAVNCAPQSAPTLQAVPAIEAPLPTPAADYVNAIALVQRRQAQDDSVVVTRGRSILLVHGRRTPRVFVLLHGFTDSPTQFAGLGERLYESGDNVYIPRLPHHAERAAGLRAIRQVTAGELVAFGDSTVDIARGLGDSVIVVGLSAGANIAASIAQRRADVFRAVLIAPAIAAGRISGELAHGIVLAGSRLPDVSRAAPADSERPDFVQGISTRGLAQVLKLGEDIQLQAQRSGAGARQIAFLLNQNDRTVSGEAAIELARVWTTGAPLVSVYQFPASLRLQHNVMEATEHGGNLELVLPVVEALARGTRPPEPAKYQFIVSDWNRPRAPEK